jgi:short-subunit dehydrogenase
MSVLIISRTESRLKEQAELLTATHKVPTKYLAYDFTQLGAERKEFYAKLDVVCQEMHTNGGIGMLINNVGKC